jgi:hypothetical protein
MSDTMGGALTPDERAELEALRSAQANANALAKGGNQHISTPSTEPTNGYDFAHGEVVRTSRPDGAQGYGLIVDRAPMSVVTPTGETKAGYRVASFGPTNDMPATAEDLGLQKLSPGDVVTTSTDTQVNETL